MKEAIRQRALALGFDDCRITTAEPPATAPQFVHWLAAQQHGEMTYLERNAGKRVDPQEVLAGARSVIALAASYAEVQSSELRVRDPKSEVRKPDFSSQGLASDRQDPASSIQHPASRITFHASRITHHAGFIARYARFRDYHDVLAERLKQLAEFVNQLGGRDTRSLWYVDTGPVLERDLAQRAGLGFIGKHTNLISRRFGNWIFLSEILTTLKLEPDPPEKNRCGTCARCIPACPTGAITAPFQLDARRCISYLTIELKGSIPVELRPAIGARVFGCDDCLAVCPWNRFAREGRLMRDYTRADLTAPDLVELLSLDEAGFKLRFGGTPICRTRRRGLLRNVCVALGNVGDAAALTALQNAAADPEPLISEHAGWAIEQIRARVR